MYPNLRDILENEAVDATELIAELYRLGCETTADKLSKDFVAVSISQGVSAPKLKLEVLTWGWVTKNAEL